MRTTPGEPRARHGVALAMALGALVVRAWRIDVQPLWFDEAMTEHIVHATHPLDFVHNAPPLYYLLLRGWVSVFGDGPGVIRSLSAVAGAAFVWASFHAARTAFGAAAAVAAGLVALASPIGIYYAQEARAYSLLLACLMIAVWMAFRLQQGAGRRAWLALVLADAAALYTHYLAAVPLLLAHAAIAATAPAATRRAVRSSLASAGGLAMLLVLPWLLWWWSTTPFRPRDMGWLGILWSSLSGLQPFALSGELLLLGGQHDHAPIFLKQFSALPFPGLLRTAGLVAAAVLVAAGAWRIGTVARERRAAFGAAAVLAVGPLIVLWLVSFVQPVYCPGRYDLVALPGVVLLLGGAAGTVSLRRGAVSRSVAAGAAGVFAFVVAVKDWYYFAAPPGPDVSRTIAAHLVRHVQSGEDVVLCGTAGLPVLAHWYEDGFQWSERVCRSPRRGLEFGCRLLPSALEEAPATVTRSLRTIAQDRLASDFVGLLATTGGIGLWLVLGPEFAAADGEDPHAAPGHLLFSVLDGAGFVLVDDLPVLRVTHWRRRPR